MITVIISGPFASGKSNVARVLRYALREHARQQGYVVSVDVDIYTTNETVAVPAGATKESW